MKGIFRMNEEGFGPAMMFGIGGPGPKKDTKGIPSDPEMEKGVVIKPKKTFKTFEQHLNLINGPAFSINDKKPGDVVEIEGEEVIIIKFLKWNKEEDAKCIEFLGRSKSGKEVKVVYDDGFDGYIIKAK